MFSRISKKKSIYFWNPFFLSFFLNSFYFELFVFLYYIIFIRAFLCFNNH